MIGINLDFRIHLQLPSSRLNLSSLFKMKVAGSLEPLVCTRQYGVIFQTKETFHNHSSQNCNLAEESNSWNYRSMKIYHVYLILVSLSFILSSRSRIFSLSLLAFLLRFLLVRLFQFTTHYGEQQEQHGK
jgi:hypothetical protein